MIPVLALSLGFSAPGAAALTVIAGIAAVLGPIPTGRLMIAVGSRRAIIVSGLVLSASNIAALVIIGSGLHGQPGSAHRLALVALLVIMAATSQVWALGRQTYLGTELPPALRARGMTTFGGMLRIGQVVGPLLGAVVMAMGHESWVFALFAAMTLAATAMVALFMVPGEGDGADAEALADAAEAESAEEPARIAATAEARPDARAVLARMVRVGLAITPVMMGRINRPVIVPLLGASLALDATSISVIFGIAAVIEIIMFVPAGAVMDRYGRAAVAVPCSATMGIGYVLLAILAPSIGRDGTAGALIALLVPSLLIALGNGLGSGIVMTLGIDVSPERGRTRYLSWWNTVIGVGRLTAPLLVTAVTLVAPIAAASAVSGALCLGGATMLARVLGPSGPTAGPAETAAPTTPQEDR